MENLKSSLNFCKISTPKIYRINPLPCLGNICVIYGAGGRHSLKAEAILSISGFFSPSCLAILCQFFVSDLIFLIISFASFCFMPKYSAASRARSKSCELSSSVMQRLSISFPSFLGTTSYKGESLHPLHPVYKNP